MTTILEKTTGLVAFVRTIEAGSFSAASRLVGSSQSAISKSVAALERRAHPAVHPHAEPDRRRASLL
jgi:hypothetical protein